MVEIPWKTLSSRAIYRNKWLSLREDQVALPDGQQTIYGVVTPSPKVVSEGLGVLPQDPTLSEEGG